MPILLYLLLAVHVIVSLLMILVVLMQRPRSEGLGAAFGGGVTDNLFGAQTTHVLAKFTTWLGIVFFALTLGLAMVYARMGASPASSEIQRELLSMPEPAATTTPVPLPAAASTPVPAATVAPTPATTPAPAAAAIPTPAASAPSPLPAASPAAVKDAAATPGN